MTRLIRRILFVATIIAFSSISLQSQVRVQNFGVKTLKEAFDLVNFGTFTGDIEIKIDSSTVETATAVLFASGVGGANYTSVTIYPTAVCSITGNLPTALIELRDADDVTIDGRINRTGTSNALTIYNQYRLANNVIWINRVATGDGARRNTVRNCNIRGNSATAASVAAGIATGSADATAGSGSGDMLGKEIGSNVGAAGNDSLQILYNNFARLNQSISINGIASPATMGLVVEGNNFGNGGAPDDACSYGVYATYLASATITNNVFSSTSSTLVTGYYFSYISASTLSNNVVKNSVAGTNITGVQLVQANNNVIDNFTLENSTGNMIYGVNLGAGTGNTVSNIIVKDNLASSTLYCVYSTGTSQEISNVVAENNQTTGATALAYGIYLNASSGSKIRDSRVTNLKGGGNTYGIGAMNSANAVIENNIVENITSFNPTTLTMSAHGIYMATSNAAVIANNSISSVYDGTNKATVNYISSGIMLASGVGYKVYYNSINMYGSNLGTNVAPGRSAGITLATVAVNSCDIRNNTFVNTMTRNTAGSKSYAIYMAGAGNWSNATIDYNNYYVEGANGVMAGVAALDYTTIAAFKAASAANNQHSINIEPDYNSESNLRPFIGSSLVGLGTPIINYTKDLLGTTRSTTATTIGAFEETGDFVAPSLNYIPLVNTTSLSNRDFFATIIDKQAVDATNSKPRIYFRKTTNANTFAGNTPAADGWKYTEGTQLGNSFQFEIDYSLLNGVAPDTDIEYFIVAQDIATVPNVAYSTVEFATKPTSVALTAANFPVTVSETEYSISLTLSGTYQIGQGQTYTTLTGKGGFFEAVKRGIVTGDLNLEITSDITETGEFPLVQYITEGGAWGIKIYPTGNYTISGSVYPALLELNDADRVTIDGRVNMMGDQIGLTIQNYAASGAVIWMNRANAVTSNGARNNTVKYCKIIGGSSTNTGAYGIVIGGKASLTSDGAGNHNNSIENNQIYRAYYGVRAVGAAGTDGYTQSLAIRNNYFGNYNSLIDDAFYYSIYVLNASDNIIESNTFKANSLTFFYAIYSGYTENAIIRNNTISECNSVSQFYSIFDEHSSNSQIYGNEISYNDSRSIWYGIYANYSNAVDMHDNVLKSNRSVNTIYPIYVNYGGACSIVNNKIIDHIGATSYVLQVINTPSPVIKSNVIKNVTGTSSVYGITVRGAAASPSTNALIEGNTIQNLRNLSATASYCLGIYLHSYSQNAKVYNNVISGLFQEFGSTDLNYIAAGIKVQASDGHKIYHNTINMWGENFVTNEAVSTSAAIFLHDAAAKSVTAKNNVFVNKVVNETDSKAYALLINNVASLTGTMLDYNDYYVSGSQGVLAKIGNDEIQDLSALRAVTKSDTSSVSVEPVFNSEQDVVPFTGSPLPQLGTALSEVTKDIMGNNRDQATPTLGAYELVGDFVAPEIEITPLKNTISVADRQFTAKITDISGINSSAAMAPRVYYRKSNNSNTLIDNTPLTDGWKYTTAVGSTPNFTFNIDISKIFGGVDVGDEIIYFVVAQDSSINNIAGVSSGEFKVTPESVELTAANFPVNRVQTSYKITLGAQGTFSVGQGKQFTSLTGEDGAFAFLNDRVLVGDVNLELTSDLLESGIVELNRIDSEGPNAPYFINIYPTEDIIISGDVPDKGLITFRDVDRLIFDGRINRTGSVNSIILQNHSETSAGIWLKRSSYGAGCNQVTIRNINFIGASYTNNKCYSIAASGEYSIETQGTHNNISILYNNFKKSYYAIRMYGATAAPNKNVYVRFNTFGNNATIEEGHFYSIYLYYTHNALISHNTISVNSDKASYSIYAFYSNELMCYDNLIENCNVGTQLFYGMYLYQIPNSQIYNNVGSGILSGNLYFMYAQYADKSIITNNILKNSTVNTNLYYCYISFSPGVILSSNSLENVTTNTFNGIWTSYSPNVTLEGNIMKNIVTGGDSRALYVASTSTANRVINNKVENISGGSKVYGLFVDVTSRDLFCDNNAIKNLTSLGDVFGIYINNSKAPVVTNNTIESIRQISGSTTSYADGIFIGTASDSSYIVNNSISGVYSSVNRTAAAYIPSGIKLNAGTTHRVLYNSINLYGSNSSTPAATGASSAFTISADAVTKVDVRNNIFNNKMYDATSPFNAYSVYILSTASLNGSTLDYNDYYSSGANKKFGYLGANVDSLSAWINLSNMDQHSISVDPAFNNDKNLMPFDGSLVLGAGIPISDVLYDKTGVERDTANPSIGAYELAGDFDPPQITFTPLGNTSEFFSRSIQAEIYDLNGVNTSNNPPRIYFRKKSNQNMFIDNTPGTDGWKYTDGIGISFNFTFTIDYNLIYGGVSAGDEIEYFMVAQDNSPFSLTRTTSGEFNAPVTSTILNSQHFPVTFVEHSYRISTPLAGIVDVGVGKSYTSLTNADGLFAAINSGILVGDLQIRITSNLNESGTVPLMQIESENNEQYTIWIYPNGEYTINGSSANAIIHFKDADNVIFDGRINRSGNTNALTINNNQQGSTVFWVTRGTEANSNGSRNVTIRNCNIVGASSGSNCYGIVASAPSSLTTAASGIDSLKILYNNIRRAYYGMRLFAAEGSQLVAPQIVGNNFGNNGNPDDGMLYAIYTYYIRNARIDSNVFKISGNTGVYGVYSYRGYDMSIQGNTFTAVTASPTGTIVPFYLYYVQNSIVSDNVVTGCNSNNLYGIQSSYSSVNTYTNNRIEYSKAHTLFYPIYTYYGTDNLISHNIINSNENDATGTFHAIFIYNESRSRVKNNTITNLYGNGSIAAVYLQATGTTSPSNYVTILDNYIHNIFRPVVSYGNYLAGIVVSNYSDNATIANNRISGIYDVSVALDAISMPAGIRLDGSKNTALHYNTVNLAGSSLSTGASNTAALAITGTAYVGLNAKNNIFVNTLTGSTGTKSYAIYVDGTGISNVSLNNNNYYAAGPNAQFAYMGGELQDITEWKNATGEDALSTSINPLFVSPTDLRLLTTSPLIGAGTPVPAVPTDILGVTRSVTTPTVGAYENGVVIGEPTLRLPLNGSIDVVTNPTLMWESVTQATGYDVQVSTSADFDTFVYNGTTTGLSHSLASLSYNTQYFWRVRALKGTDHGDWSAVWNFTTKQGTATQTFALVNGWNMISANVEPANTSMSSILSPLSGNLQQAKNVYGEIYAPPFTNTLTNWNKYHAYQIRMTTSAQLQIDGTPIVPEATPITLNQLGWYWLPYYRTSSMPTATALASISGKYLQVKTITGEVYQPPFATTLANLDPNKGYMIRLTATDGTLTYPSNSAIKQSTSNAPILEPKVFVRENNVTGKTAFIALDLNANEGDEIGVFTRDGMLVGSSVWQNALRGVVVWGDDEFTSEKDGASEGEELIVKVWNSSNKNIGEVSQITLSDMTNNAKEYTLRYETDVVYFLKGNVETTSSTLTVTPQPATTEVMLNLGIASEGEVEVKLFNQAGQLMLVASESAMNGIIKLNTSGLPSGVYQAMINVDGSVHTARIVIVK